MSIIIKVYPNGLMSNKLVKLEEREIISFRAPLGGNIINKDNQFCFNDRIFSDCKNLNLIAGGSGVADILQSLYYMNKLSLFSNYENINILYTVQYFNDIIYYDELEQLSAKYDNIHISYYLTREQTK